MVGVSWDNANEFCRWAGVRLPTPDEWEAAARYPDGREYAWGNDARSGLERSEGRGGLDEYRDWARSVDVDPQPPTVLGLLHTCSNVQEYVAGVADDGAQAVCIKGRSFADPPTINVSTIMSVSGRGTPSFDRGFRVVHRVQRKEKGQ
ncbi:MAG: SUMF1/EgtB/PvdO family nonheme iron enzyme [Pyrinomonadaceae bacterium]|nr:SUMF1/EgtB/PvdO family nonheme iron enzyme [Phycisphaerales bacterium]